MGRGKRGIGSGLQSDLVNDVKMDQGGVKLAKAPPKVGDTCLAHDVN